MPTELVNMFDKKCVLVLIASLVICEASIADYLVKCSKDDFDCQTGLIQNIYSVICGGGAEEDFHIPKCDPYHLKNLKLEVPDLITANLVEGDVKGLKTCKITEFKPDYEVGRTTLDMKCERISVKGHYTVSSSAPLLKTLLGGEEVHGDGDAQIKLENLKMKLLTYFDLIEKDGEIYVKDKKFEILDLNIDNAKFNITNIYVGKEESSDKVNELLKTSWKPALTTFGPVFGKSVIHEGFRHLRKLLSKLPVRQYIIEDLSSYVKK